MDPEGPEATLRSAIAEGLARLDAARGGRFLSQVARELGVERSTVSRWRGGRSTPQPDHCETLARRWPDYFDPDDLADLQVRVARGGAHHGLTVGVDVFDEPAAILRAVTDRLRAEPERAADRVYRHVAFHLDRKGTDPVDPDTADPHFQRAAGAEMADFRAALAARAGEGWDVKVVVSAGNPARYESLVHLVESLDGPAVEVFAYPLSVPLVVTPVMIANRDVVMAHDHRRFERPGAGLVMRSASVARWAGRYVDALAADAPFRLRDPGGIDRRGLDGFRAALG